jgi:hypothetical protein
MVRYLMAALRALARAFRATAEHVSRWIPSKLAQAVHAAIALLHRLQEFVAQLREVIARWRVATDS